MSKSNPRENEYCVYMHTAPNGKRYIGQTKQKPKYRFNNGEGYKGCAYFYSAIQKYGWKNFNHEVLKDNLSAEDADYFESFYISLYKTNDKKYGYNLRTGGTSGYEYSEDVKSKMSEINKGRKQSDTTCQKRSESLKKYYQGHTVSEETREKLRKPNSGQFQKGVSHSTSPETRKKISEALKGRKGKAPSEEGLRRISRPVIQYDLDMNTIAAFPSIAEASRATGIKTNAITHCTRGRCKTSGGFIWRYA